MAFLAVEWIVFLLVGVYIDLVFPQQGYRKHPLFFLGFPWSRKTSNELFSWQRLKALFCWPKSRSSQNDVYSPTSSFESNRLGSFILYEFLGS